MLSFFRLNDPYRLIPVFIIMLLIRLPFMIDLASVTFYEIKWMALGAKMAAGDTMYIDIWDNTAPLSAGLFWLIDVVFGRSHFVYLFLALLISIYQCALFNSHIIRNNAMQENTYLPALLYGVLISMSEEFMILSPLLIGLTFFMMSLNNIFGQIQIRAKRDEKIMIIGIYMGIATMCHYVYAIFFAGVILTLMIFSGTVLRRYLLMVTGFLIPVALVSLYYLLNDGLLGMAVFGTAFSWSLGSEWHIERTSMLILLGFPSMLLLLSLVKLAGRSRLSNYQSRLLQVMILYLILGILCFFGFAEKSMMPLIVLVPSLAYLFSQYFLLFRRRILTEIWFLFGVLMIAATSFTFHYGWFGLEEVLSGENVLISEKREEYEGKTVLILGENWSVLRTAKSVTPFFNWKIASEVFENLDYYDDQSVVLEQITKASPEYVIDDRQLFRVLQGRFPSIATKYARSADPNVYRRLD